MIIVKYGGERSAPSQQTSFLKMMQKGRVVQLKEEEKRDEQKQLINDCDAT